MHPAATAKQPGSKKLDALAKEAWNKLWAEAMFGLSKKKGAIWQSGGLCGERIGIAQFGTAWG